MLERAAERASFGGLTTLVDRATRCQKQLAEHKTPLTPG